MTKINTTLRLNPEMMHKAKQLAASQHRNFTNLVELLLIKEIETAEKTGFKFDPFIDQQSDFTKNPVDTGGEVVGKGPDQNLKNEFGRFMEK